MIYSVLSLSDFKVFINIYIYWCRKKKVMVVAQGSSLWPLTPQRRAATSDLREGQRLCCITAWGPPCGLEGRIGGHQWLDLPSTMTDRCMFPKHIWGKGRKWKHTVDKKFHALLYWGRPKTHKHRHWSMW